MSTRALLACAFALSLSACGGAPAEPSPESDVSVLDTGGKTDSASSLLTTAIVDAAQARVFATLGSVPNTSLSNSLVAAAKRGVDVELYVVLPKPASAATVLAEQHLEASGVHVIVDRENRCGYGAVVDAQLRTLKSTGAISTTKSKTRVKKALNAFQNVLGRPAAASPRSIEPGSISLHVMPDDTGAEILDLLAGAKSSIDLEIYQVEDPAVTHELTEAAARGVKVRVMLEPKTVGAKNYDAELAALKAAGVEVQPTPPTFDKSNNVDHAKFMLIDGTGLAYGTGNLVCSGQGGNPAQEFDNRDFWIEDGRADVVAEASQIFAADWARQSSSGSTFATLVVTPDDAQSDVLALIDGAKKKLYVENQSLNDPTVIDHLVAAKKKGVDVRVLLGLQPGFGGKPPANQAAIDTLSAAGIPAALFSRHYLHAKIIVADGKAFVGSQNFTSGGLRNNRELGGILDDPMIVGQLEQVFVRDQQSPTP